MDWQEAKVADSHANTDVARHLRSSLRWMGGLHWVLPINSERIRSFPFNLSRINSKRVRRPNQSPNHPALTERASRVRLPSNKSNERWLSSNNRPKLSVDAKLQSTENFRAAIKNLQSAADSDARLKTLIADAETVTKTNGETEETTCKSER